MHPFNTVTWYCLKQFYTTHPIYQAYSNVESKTTHTEVKLNYRTQLTIKTRNRHFPKKTVGQTWFHS